MSAVARKHTSLTLSLSPQPERYLIAQKITAEGNSPDHNQPVYLFIADTNPRPYAQAKADASGNYTIVFSISREGNYRINTATNPNDT
jgi:hypothetical protein